MSFSSSCADAEVTAPASSAAAIVPDQKCFNRAMARSPISMRDRHRGDAWRPLSRRWPPWVNRPGRIPEASAGKTAGIEKGLFGGRRGAAQNCVAVRKSAEAADNVGVEFCPFQSFGIAVGAEQRDATLLIGGVFGVFERKIEELALRRGNPLIEAAGDGAISGGTGQCIGCESVGAATKHVAGKLV